MLQHRRLGLVLAITLISMVCACDETSSTSSGTIPPAGAQSAPSPARPVHDATPPGDDASASDDSSATARTDPQIELRVIAAEDASEANYTAEATATFRTGGWDIATDSVEVAGGEMVWRVTVTRPAPGEIVTQAFQTRTIRHDGHDGPVRSAELQARVVVRGELSATLYSVFATWP